MPDDEWSNFNKTLNDFEAFWKDNLKIIINQSKKKEKFPASMVNIYILIMQFV